MITVAGTRVSRSRALETASARSALGREADTIDRESDGRSWGAKGREMREWRPLRHWEIEAEGAAPIGGRETGWRRCARVLEALGISNFAAMARKERKRA